MKMELLHNGCLKILLSDRELAAMELDLFAAESTEPHTRAAIRRLVRIAGKEVGFPTEGKITVEAIPLQGGCLLLLSPAGTHSSELPTAAPPQIWCTDDFGALLTTAHILPEIYTSLYHYKGRFYLCYYALATQPSTVDTVLREFFSPVPGGHITVAWLNEHGVCLAVGDALTRLRFTAPESRAPEPPDPPR